jgi:hypothetical protein
VRRHERALARVSRRRKEHDRGDHTTMAFVIAAIFGCTVVAVVEDAWYFATGVVFWNTRRFHPDSIFLGALAFTGLLYFLQRMNNGDRAVQYVQPYLPLVVLSGANVALKLNPAWLLPVALACIGWSVVQVRRVNGGKAMSRRISAVK